MKNPILKFMLAFMVIVSISGTNSPPGFAKDVGNELFIPAEIHSDAMQVNEPISYLYSYDVNCISIEYRVSVNEAESNCLTWPVTAEAFTVMKELQPYAMDRIRVKNDIIKDLLNSHQKVLPVYRC